MQFNTITFVLLFCVFYLIYISVQGRLQTLFLLMASYVIYSWWDTRFLGLLLTTTLVDYTVGLAMGHAGGRLVRRLLLFASLGTNLGILFVFKYFGFFADSLWRLFSILGFQLDPVTLHVLLPVGISFYTFRSLTYTVDIYRNQVKPTRSLLDYAVFVSFFPELIAGPIERAGRFLPQIAAPRTISYSLVCEGVWLILLGYFKKAVVADNMAVIANAVFNKPGQYHGLAVLLGVYAFTFQIYGDFSGYSDIARGLARLLGFSPTLNFRMPYFAVNPQEFWRRWHISLSTWLRDYLYISMGGNRRGTLKTYRNLLLTMVLGGLWHGAAWNFVLWGAYHGVALVLHRVAVTRSGSKQEGGGSKHVMHILKLFLMFHVTAFGWILFRIRSISDLPVLLSKMPMLEHLPIGWVFSMAVLLCPLAVVDWIAENRADMLAIWTLPAGVRVAVYATLFTYILLCGRVQGYEFIYAQF